MTVESMQNDTVRTLIDLVDDAPQLMASVKGLDGRYLYVNKGFCHRLGRDADRIVGRTVHDLFAPDLAESYARQDESVLATKRPLRAHLELIVRADGSLGWYLTSKSVVCDAGGVVAVAALSVDLDAQLHSAHAGLAAAVVAIRADPARPWRVAELAAIAGLSPVQLERRCRRTLGLPPRALIQRLRVERAVHLITTTDATLGTVAHECGFYDQSSFTRQFRALLGLTPGAYRSAR